VEKGRTLTCDDHHLSIRILAEKLNMDKRTARQIIPKKFEHDKSLSQDGAEEFEQSTIIKKKNLC
jgi:hypothetical protein